MTQDRPPETPLDLAALSPLVLVGAGNMGGAMLEGWLERGADPGDIRVLDPAPKPAVVALCEKFGVKHAARTDEIAAPAGLLLIAVKPQAMAAVLPTLSGLVGGETVLASVAAGTTIATLGAHLEPGAIVRVMPNTPAQVGRSMSVAVADRVLPPAVRDGLTAVLQAIGEVAWVEDEAEIDAVTGLSGSGPAYVFHMVEAMAAAGVAAGLSPELAERLARQTVAGAGELLHQSPETAETLRRNVTSPGGTTAAGLGVLMNDETGLTQLMTRTVAAAAERSRELARGD